MALGIGAIQATVALLFAGLAARLLRPSSASLRHAVWATALGATLLLPVAGASLPALHVFRLPVSIWPFGAAAPAMPQASPSFRAMPAGLFPADAPLPGSPEPDRTPAWLWPLVAAIWAGGAACVGGRTVRAHLRARSLLRRATRIRSGPLPRLLGTLAAPDEPCPVALFESAEIGGPATVGIWRPVMVVPVSARSWNPGEARAVLAHELAHARRRDCLTHVLSRVACAAYWFNPLIWIAARRMAVERERACDDAVLDAGAIPTDYASLLVDLVRSGSGLASPASALALVRTGELEIRVRAILDPGLTRRACPPFTRSVLGVSMAGMVFFSGSIGLEQAPDRAAGMPTDAAQVAPPVPPGTSLEPDRRADSLSTALSERLPLVDVSYAVRRSRAAEAGPDSGFVRVLRGALGRISRGPADLVRERAVWALSQVERGRLTEPLLEHLRHADWRVRCYAAWALAQSSDLRAVAPLTEQLEDPNWRVRAMASFALLAIGDRGAWTDMLKRLDDEAWQVRVNVVAFAGLFEDEQARSALRAGLADSHAAVRGAAEDAIGR